jgi:RsiW-degrading membrane proteinase PrsW (M82 family)
MSGILSAVLEGMVGTRGTRCIILRFPFYSLDVKSLIDLRFRGSSFRLPVAVPDPISTFMPRLQPRHYARFWILLTGGFGILVGLTYETISLRSIQLEGLFVILGSLYTPALFVYYLDLTSHFVEPRWRTIVWTFVLGGVIGCPLALVLEVTLLPKNIGAGALLPALEIGLIEEFAKVTAVFWLLRRKHRDLAFEMDGIIVGAAAGMGFAALEDMLYGASAFHSGLTSVVTVVWLRLLLGAFGHGTWTAIVVGTIWREKGSGPPRINGHVIRAYLVAAGLHGAWDWMPVSGFGALLWLVGVGVVGLLILRAMVHQALGQEDAYVGREGLPTQRSPAGGVSGGP